MEIKRKRITLWITENDLERLKALKVVTGKTVTRQINRAVKEYLESQGTKKGGC